MAMRWILFALVAIAALGADRRALAEVNAGTAGERLVAALPSPFGLPLFPTALVPKVLTAADVRRYQQLFAVQEAGDWARANELIAALDDRVLMGHALLQRYMHPTAYRSRFDELAAWLREYADHPGAQRIYRLALRRQPAGAPGPVAPDTAALRGHGEVGHDIGRQLPTRTLGATERESVEALRTAIGQAVSAGEPARAEAVLRRAKAVRWLTVPEHDALAAKVARGYFAVGADPEAKRLAEAAAQRSGVLVPEAWWTAGLAAWRLGDPETAAGHFVTLADAEGTTPHLLAGAAFWGARASEALDRPREAERLLRAAAGHPRSVYGLMALHRLHEAPGFSWEPPRLGAAAVRLLVRDPTVRRAVALSEAGFDTLAEAELRHLYPHVSREAAAALLVLAEQLNLPGLQIRLGSHLARADAGRHHRALYPLPDWQPEGGFRVDRALIFALVRQESVFEPQAESHVGARGLMQLMPRTARYVNDRNTDRAGTARALLMPSRNLSLGQSYIEHLLELDHVSGNLIYLLASYNAGPARLAAWRKRLDDTDPLLFVESMPSFETRRFVRGVLANLWAYRLRLGQHADSLNALAAGDWPIYRSHDSLERLADLTDSP